MKKIYYLLSGLTISALTLIGCSKSPEVFEGVKLLPPIVSAHIEYDDDTTDKTKVGMLTVVYSSEKGNVHHQEKVKVDYISKLTFQEIAITPVNSQTRFVLIHNTLPTDNLYVCEGCDTIQINNKPWQKLPLTWEKK